MAKTHYNKPSLTFQRQLQQLIDRGMTVEDPQKALHLLGSVSYYRISGIGIRFWPTNKDMYLSKAPSLRRPLSYIVLTGSLGR